jgi:hypothetical protein
VETNRRAAAASSNTTARTGVFDDDRYFDVEVEYAKAGPRTSSSASPFTIAAPRRHGCVSCPRLVPQHVVVEPPRREAVLRAVAPGSVGASHPDLGEYHLCATAIPSLLFTRTSPTTSGCERPEPLAVLKDAFHTCVVDGRPER